MKWKDFFRPEGVFISEVIDASNIYDGYILKTHADYSSENNEDIEVQIRHSEDGVVWTDWYSTDGLSSRLADGVTSTYNLLIQYRVILKASQGASPSFHSLSIDGEVVFEIENVGDLPHKPKIWIKKLNTDGDVRLKNITTNEELVLTNLKKDEVVYIDNEDEQILTDIPLLYRFDDHNDVFLSLDVGSNIILGQGDFELDVKMEFQILA